VMFAALVLIVEVASRDNAMTALGAAIFFWARLAYAVIYVAGIAWLRTAAWFVSVVGMALIAIQLF
ncbi:MAG TPA: MAPEG family protein, partial [Reyranellaceae bacterium]|nr:MAPEG family protein [Reyranellaceae bacterium]